MVHRLVRGLTLQPVEVLQKAMKEQRNILVCLLCRVIQQGRDSPVMRPAVLVEELRNLAQESHQPQLEESDIASALALCQSCVVLKPNRLLLAFRMGPKQWTYASADVECLSIKAVTVSQYLQLKERLAGPVEANPFAVVEINMLPFNQESPIMQNKQSIGQGVQFLNRFLSSSFFAGDGACQLVDWLCNIHCGREESRLLDSRIITDVGSMRQALANADQILQSHDDTVCFADVAMLLQRLGFRSGWGKNVGLIREMFCMFLDILQAPDADTLEKFLARLPFVQTVVILSPHGFFGQANVLGLPDTGGQVVYILDQVRAVEAEMRTRLEDAGRSASTLKVLVVTRLIPENRGTTCNERMEAIEGTENSFILRVPFRDETGRVLKRWVSRFDVYPYLERFALDVETEVVATLQGKPDLLIGNYTDGNLVATLLNHRMGTTQAGIAHALEMCKYPDSGIYWKDFEKEYHFGGAVHGGPAEIAGQPGGGMGQYEAFTSFSLPGLYRVTDGINCYDPKFNIVSPGADQDVYFPYTCKERRLTSLHCDIKELLYGDGNGKTSVGHLDAQDRPILFAMARLDKVKNLTGLTELFGRSERLRGLANLVVVGGVVDPGATTDREEQAQCTMMHELMDKYKLHGQMRWLVAQGNRVCNGELYRCVCDTRGAFVQPALYEAFGLTVIEAMTSGLPTFATLHGGPAEIIKHTQSGFHIDPHHGDKAADIMADFLESCKEDPSVWDAVSACGLERIRSRYTWGIYASRLMTLARVYTFWRHVSDLSRVENKKYLEALYTLLYRPLMLKVPLTRDDPDKDAAATSASAPSPTPPRK
ncbi:MAG: hypothetical protein WDW38_003470 [Sanguina aurantia]